MEIFPVFKLKMAKAVKTLLGSNRELCKQIMESLQEEKKRGKDIGILANYIGIIAWTDMSAYKWIYECLMLTSSPVFMHEVVRAEIGLLVETLEKIIRC